MKPARLMAAMVGLPASIAMLAVSAPAAWAQEVQEAEADPIAAVPEPPANPTLAQAFGAIGLISEFNTTENFGNAQLRLGSARSHQSLANAGGPTTGYRDTVDNYIAPIKATYALPGSGNRWYVKGAMNLVYSRGRSGNLTRSSIDSYTGQLQLIRQFGSETAIGVGLIGTDSSVDVLHNEARIETSGLGAELDAMHKFTPRFGLFVRVTYDGLERRTTLARDTGPVTTVAEGERVYAEASAVYLVTHETLPIVPEGWRLRPVLTALYQNSHFDSATNSAGGPVPASDEGYAALAFTSRLESTRFEPWKLRPYMTVGTEWQLLNEASQVDDDPGNLYLRAGLAMNPGGAGRVEFYAVRRDSFEGTFSATNLSVLVTLQL